MDQFLSSLDENRAFDLEQAYAAVHRLIEQVVRRSRKDGEDRPRIVGQEALVRRLITALILGEHCLLEGFPGLVKTEVSKTVAAMLGLVFRRIQFTPDMMPSEIISRERLDFRGDKLRVRWEPGPIFTNVLLADEINRASSKVQAALLEATAERRVTSLDRGTLSIRPRGEVDEAALLAKQQDPIFGVRPSDGDLQHFMVLATMNPIEQEGVFPLSEAQLDRFAFKVIVDYPLGSDLKDISEHAFEHPPVEITHHPEEHVKTLFFLTRLRDLLLGRKAQERWFDADNQDLRSRCEYLIDFSHLGPPALSEEDDAFESLPAPPTAKSEELQALLSVWQASGDPELSERAEQMWRWRHLESYPEVRSGASPRGLLKLIRAAHAEAFLNHHLTPGGRGVVPTWADVCAVAPDVLRHRIRLTSGAEALGMRSDHFIRGLLEWLDT